MKLLIRLNRTMYTMTVLTTGRRAAEVDDMRNYFEHLT